MQPETIRRTVSLFEEQPEKAKSSPTVKAHADGSQAAMEAGPFSWRSDLPELMGGTNQAHSPTALLLSALAGCAVAFIRDTLATSSASASMRWRPPRGARRMRAAC
jgi:organic hydroperoxide reductase OsmC/OhrA